MSKIYWSIVTTCLLLVPAGRAYCESPNFVLISSYNLKNFQEKTPNNDRKILEQSHFHTLAYRTDFGLALGASYLSLERHAPDSKVSLQSPAISLGFVGSRYFTLMLSYLPNPSLRYEFPSIRSETSYLGGNGTILDLGFHFPIFGVDWLQIGPRFNVIDVNYKKNQIKTPDTEESIPLEGSPWRDRWIESYFGIWILI